MSGLDGLVEAAQGHKLGSPEKPRRDGVAADAPVTPGSAPDILVDYEEDDDGEDVL